MKKLYMALALAVSAAPALAGTNVGVSVNVYQPGLYGRIDIGQAPMPPTLVYEQPMVIVPSPVAVQRQPIYLHVPSEHQRDWRRYCGRYSACGQPVYFVREDWYQQHYRHEHERGWERERHEHRDHRDDHHRDDHHDDHDHDHDHDRHHDHDR